MLNSAWALNLSNGRLIKIKGKKAVAVWCAKVLLAQKGIVDIYENVYLFKSNYCLITILC